MQKKQAPNNTKNLGGDVAEFSRDLWLAGLGAVATVEEEGVKFYENLLDTSSKRLKDLEEGATMRFEELVKRGEAFEQKGRAQLTAHVEAAKEHVGAAKEEVGSVKEDLTARRQAVRHKVEEAVAGSVEKTLAVLDVPTSADVHALTEQVERLTKQVNDLAASLAG